MQQQDIGSFQRTRENGLTAPQQQGAPGSESTADQAREKAQQAVGQGQDRLRGQVDQRSTQVGSRISDQASDLRTVSRSLREQGDDGPAQAADRLADYAERVGDYLREKDSHALLSDAEDFGRRQPLAVAAAGLAAGFAASRLLKASSSTRYQARTAQRPRGVYTHDSQRTADETPTAERPAQPRPPIPAAGSRL